MTITADTLEQDALRTIAEAKPSAEGLEFFRHRFEWMCGASDRPLLILDAKDGQLRPASPAEIEAIRRAL